MTDLEPLAEAVTEFASRAAEKLRKQGSAAGQVLVFAHTSPFRPGPRCALKWCRCAVPRLTPGYWWPLRPAGLQCIYEPGFAIAKAGVMLLDLSHASLSSPSCPWRMTQAKTDPA